MLFLTDSTNNLNILYLIILDMILKQRDLFTVWKWGTHATSAAGGGTAAAAVSRDASDGPWGGDSQSYAGVAVTVSWEWTAYPSAAGRERWSDEVNYREVSWHFCKCLEKSALHKVFCTELWKVCFIEEVSVFECLVGFIFSPQQLLYRLPPLHMCCQVHERSKSFPPSNERKVSIGL